MTKTELFFSFKALPTPPLLSLLTTLSACCHYVLQLESHLWLLILPHSSHIQAIFKFWCYFLHSFCRIWPFFSVWNSKTLIQISLIHCLLPCLDYCDFLLSLASLSSKLPHSNPYKTVTITILPRPWSDHVTSPLSSASSSSSSTHSVYFVPI